jgi:hypothetical protein
MLDQPSNSPDRRSPDADGWGFLDRPDIDLSLETAAETTEPSLFDRVIERLSQLSSGKRGQRSTASVEDTWEELINADPYDDLWGETTDRSSYLRDTKEDDSQLSDTSDEEWAFESPSGKKSVLDHIREHSKAARVAAAVVAGVILIPRVLESLEHIEFSSSTPTEQSPKPDKPSVPLPELADPATLSPVLNSPILPRDVVKRATKGKSRTWDPKAGEISPLVEGYKPKFVGAYQSTEGVQFNIYAATQPGKEKALDQDFQVHPESIEFILRQITANIKNAPKNTAKLAIMNNLAGIKDGFDQRILNLVFDVSPTVGCLDAKGQLVSVMQKACQGRTVKLGVTQPYDYDYGPHPTEEWPIVISTGSKPVRDAVSSQGWTGNGPKREPDPADMQQYTTHELVHGLSSWWVVSRKKLNTYKEGDPDHETTAWLLGEEGAANYDFKGATAPSPQIGKKIDRLVNQGKLPPILSVRAPRRSKVNTNPFG